MGYNVVKQRAHALRTKVLISQYLKYALWTKIFI